MGNLILLSNFKPFNGMKKMFPLHNFPYINCSYNSMLTLANFYNKDELPVLNNVVTNYRFNEENIQTEGYFKLEVIDFKSTDKILNELGVSLSSKFIDTNSVESEIVNALSRGNPILINIDLFYQKGREFYYNKKHGMHPVLIFGINFSSNQIYIVDDIKEYKQYSIPFSEFRNSYRNTNSNIKISEFSVYRRDNKIDQSELLYRNVYDFVENMKHYQIELQKGISNLLLFAENFIHVIKKEDLIETLSSTIYRKCSEKYRLKVLFDYNIVNINDKENIDSLLNGIINNWMLVRNISVKAMISENRSSDIINKCINIIKDIHLQEIEYHQQFYLMLNAIKKPKQSEAF